MMMDGSNSICARWQLFSTGEVSQLLWGLINRTHLMMREDPFPVSLLQTPAWIRARRQILTFCRGPSPLIHRMEPLTSARDTGRLAAADRSGGGSHMTFIQGNTDGSITTDSTRHKGCESRAGFTGSDSVEMDPLPGTCFTRVGA